MNRRESGEGIRRISNCFKDRDEELSFFRDLKKREKDQVASLLQPVSEEFEANGSFGLSRMNSGGRRGAGNEFLGESGKNDYNWLKTPPATPLFPSLEMETVGQELVLQREIPIIQPLSRFAGNSEGNYYKATTNNIPSSPKPKPKPPQRHKTPSRPTTPSFVDKKNMKNAPLVGQKPSTTSTDKTKPAFTPIVKSTISKESRSNFPTSNTSRNTKIEPSSSAKPSSRGVSPLVRPSTHGVSTETPPNLRTTNRPTSATRGRPAYQNPSAPQKQDTNTNMNTYTSTKVRRQSCSPSVTRGRKPEGDGSVVNESGASRANQIGGNGRVQVLGSKMVDKFMTARMSSADDRRLKIKLSGSMNESSRIGSNGEERQLQPKIKLNGSLNESSGFGRLMSKTSLDMAIKHMDIQRDSSNGRKIGMVPGRRS